ncbi:MAG: hypoxanthine phosphoribosyltransferase, partial [Acidimicrobiales bacterium]
PSLAEVGRTLAVAAGTAVGTELSGGRRVRRTGGRLRVEPARRSGNVTPVTHDESGAGVPSWAAADVGPVLVDAERLAARVAELGAQITEDYAGEPPLLVAVLKGAMLFMSDLCRAIALPVDVDFMAVSSYGSATKTSGVVRIVKDLDSELEGRHVLVVEDIIDSGLTLNYLRRYLNARQPKSVEICALLVKEGEQRVDLDLRYIGFTIPPEFVVGYGLDVSERYRNLRGVHRYKGAET